MIAFLQIHWVPVLAVAGLLTAALGVVWLWCLARRCWRGTPAVGRDVGLGVPAHPQPVRTSAVYRSTWNRGR